MPILVLQVEFLFVECLLGYRRGSQMDRREHLCEAGVGCRLHRLEEVSDTGSSKLD